MPMFQPLRRYAQFRGRARRAEYWLWILFLLLLGGAIVAASGGVAMGDGDGARSVGVGRLLGVPIPVAVTGDYWWVLPLNLVLLVPTLAVTVRRLHDSDRGGWWILVHLIPVLGSLLLFVFMLLDGSVGPNRFGDDPKGRRLAAYR